MGFFSENLDSIALVSSLILSKTALSYKKSAFLRERGQRVVAEYGRNEISVIVCSNSSYSKRKSKVLHFALVAHLPEAV